MAVIVTPRQFTLRGHFYAQLAQVTAAGVTIIAALEMIARNPPARAFRQPILNVLKYLQEGATVSEAWRQLGDWVSEFDVALLTAAEQSGRLDHAFRMLSDYYLTSAALMRRIIMDLLYPVFIFHFAIFLFPFIDWFGGSLSVTGFAFHVFGVLIPLYTFVVLFIYASQASRRDTWKSVFERLMSPIPVLGTGRHYIALARLAASLEALISAGVGIIEAWELSASACGSPAIHRTVLSWRPYVSSGQTPSEMVNSAPNLFPEIFANLYHSGEVSGELDDSLRRLRDYYQEQGSDKLHLVSRWVPQLIYFAIAGYIAYKVIGFYSGYFNQIRNAGGF